MNYNKFYTLIILFYSLCSFGQVEEIKQKYDAAENYFKKKEYLKAIDNALSSLELSKENNLQNWEARCNLLLGDAYIEVKKYDEAILSFENAIPFLKKQKNEEGEAYAMSMIGDAFESKRNYKQAIEAYLKSYHLYENIEDWENCAYLASDIGNNEEKLNHTKTAIEWFSKGIKHSSEANLHNLEIEQQIIIGSLYSNFGNYKTAKDNFNKAKENAQSFGLTEYYSKIDNLLETLEYNIANKTENITEFDIEVQENTQNHIANIESIQVKTLEEIEKLSEEKQLIELKLKAQKDDYEKKILNEQLKTLQAERELEVSTASLKIKNIELDKEKALREKRRSQIIGLIVVLILIGLLALLSIIGYNNKKKSNRELNIKNKKISLQHQQLEIKNNQISDSINYAKNIQIAFLPGINTFSEQFENSFIYFNPRDKVSGDFFWHYEKKGLFYAVAADCTGHGVPGALMSIICSSIFESVLSEDDITSTSDILELCNERLVQKLKKYHKKNETYIKDGMDVSIICLDKKNNNLRYSGARNSVYICRSTELIELKATRRSIASDEGNDLPRPPFKEEIVEIKNNDMIYLFSDGFADQKGGKDKKKFFYKPFKDLLLKISKKNVTEQKIILKNTFLEWKNNEEQIDDVLIIGIKI